MHAPKPNTAGFTSTAAFLIRTRWCIIDQDTEVTASVQSAEIASSQSTQNMHMCSKHFINIALKSSQICPGNKTSIKYACPVRDLFKKVNSVVFTLIRLVLSKRCIVIIYDGRLQSEGFIDCSKRVWLCLSIFCRTVEWRYSIWRKETRLVVTHIVL